ncbi:MAG TPA: hypothetical protein VIR78_00555 [Malonomonas sp.]
MTDYIKIPTYPTQDLLRGIEAISPYPRINPQQPRPEGYPRQSNHSAAEKDDRVRRRFMSLRQLINELQSAARIDKVDFATADAELHQIGWAILEKELVEQLLQLKIPLESIEQLLPQIDQNRSAVRLDGGRRITGSESSLFPVSTAGLTEYNLKIEELKIRQGKAAGMIIDKIDQDGLCVVQQNRLRLTFSRFVTALGTAEDLLTLRLSVLLGVMESDEDDRRAILYPRADKSYGLYADKLISLSI